MIEEKCFNVVRTLEKRIKLIISIEFYDIFTLNLLLLKLINSMFLCWVRYDQCRVAESSKYNSISHKSRCLYSNYEYSSEYLTNPKQTSPVQLGANQRSLSTLYFLISCF